MRRLWPLSLVPTILPVLGLAAFEVTGATVALLIVPFLVFGILPIFDVLLPANTVNVSDEEMEAMARSRYYRIVVESTTPLQFASFLATVWWVGANTFTTVQLVLIAVNLGHLGVVGINAAHEMGHKSDRVQSWLARFSLGQVYYGHFYVEHNRGHHRLAATPEDPASGRYGESFWAFLPRSVIYSAVSAWRLESDRLRRRGHRTLSWRNKNLQSWALTVPWLAPTLLALGAGTGLWFFALQGFIGFFFLEVVNYLEHYGLCRQKLANGRYEKCEPVHSWNANTVASNIFLYQIQRHSDHHANATRPYQNLRNFDEAPNLPAGYMTMISLALVPPLWFKVMNPRVAAVYDGDLSKANLKPSLRARLG